MAPPKKGSAPNVQRRTSGRLSGQTESPEQGPIVGSNPGPNPNPTTGPRAVPGNPKIFRRMAYMEAILRIHRACTAQNFGQTPLMSAKNLNSLLEDKAEKFENAHMEVITQPGLNHAQYLAHDVIFATTNERVLEARNLIAAQIEIMTPEVIMPERGHANAQLPVRVELRAAELQPNFMELGRFDGTILQWQSFKDKFLASVHHNEHIKPVFKLQALTSALTGRARSIVGTRPATEQGYLSAWARLCEIYDDSYVIIRSILQSLFRMPSLENASHDGLRKLIDTTHEAVRQLAALGVPVDHWDQILVFILIERLDM